MPRLCDAADCQELVSDLLTVQYRGMIADEMVASLVEEFGREDADHVLEAVRRHIRNTGLNRSNEPAGKYPPSVADLLHQLQQIRLEEQRLSSEAEAAKRRLESERAGATVLQRLEWPKLAGDAGRRRSAITQALRAALHLDLLRWEDCQILWAVHQAWCDSCWVRPDDGIGWLPSGREMSVQACVELGRRLLDEQRGSRRQEAA